VEYRPEQLNLPDDPLFLPELDMNFDLLAFDTHNGSSTRSSVMSPPSFRSSHSGIGTQPGDEPALILPPAGTPLDIQPVGFGFPGDTRSGLKSGNRPHLVSVFEDTGIVENPLFEFDEEGNMVDLPPATEPISASPSAIGPVSRVGSELGLTDRVRREHEAGFQVANVRSSPRFP